MHGKIIRAYGKVRGSDALLAVVGAGIWMKMDRTYGDTLESVFGKDSSDPVTVAAALEGARRKVDASEQLLDFELRGDRWKLEHLAHGVRTTALFQERKWSLTVEGNTQTQLAAALTGASWRKAWQWTSEGFLRPFESADEAISFAKSVPLPKEWQPDYGDARFRIAARPSLPARRLFAGACRALSVYEPTYFESLLEALEPLADNPHFSELAHALVDIGERTRAKEPFQLLSLGAYDALRWGRKSLPLSLHLRKNVRAHNGVWELHLCGDKDLAAEALRASELPT